MIRKINTDGEFVNKFGGVNVHFVNHVFFRIMLVLKCSLTKRVLKINYLFTEDFTCLPSSSNFFEERV